MIEMYMLAQLVAIADCGTMTKAAEQLHLSQPALSRTINKIEDLMQVKLFDRSKNKIALNENGKLAVEFARRILNEGNNMVERVRSFDLSRRTISIVSCAPAPLWTIGPILTELYPNTKISGEMFYHDDMLSQLNNGNCQILITPKKTDSPDIVCRKLFDEQLHVSVPPAHPLAEYDEVSFSDLDGETMLLYSDLGYWHEIHKQKTPNTRYILQHEYDSMNELIKASALPCFVTNITKVLHKSIENRITIPISDNEATASFYVCWRKEDDKKFAALENWFKGRDLK